MSIKAPICYALFALAIGHSIYNSALTVAEDMDEYQAQGLCISVMIAEGIPRSSIKAVNGTCTLIK